MNAGRIIMTTEVVVTGIGLVLAGCDSRERFWEQLRDGDSQLTLTPDPSGGPEPLAVGRALGFDARQSLDELDPRLWTRHGRAVQMYLSAILRARDDAGLVLALCDRERVGLFEGTSRDGFEYWFEKFLAARDLPGTSAYTRNELLAGMPSIGPGVAAAILGIQGPTCSFSVSCCSGAVAIGHAYREIVAGEVDVAFAGGHDAALCAPLFAMYRNAGLLSAESRDPSRAIQPFVASAGNAFGEGAVVLVLESREHAERRGATILASIAGFSYGNGGAHPTHVDSSGERPARAIRSVLAQARLGTEDVGLVVGHGNGVAMSDRSELAYMDRVFDAHAVNVPLVSTKPLWGHTLGASSAVNVAAGVMTAHHGAVTSMAIRPPKADGSAAPLPASNRLGGPAVVCVSLGIGGNNAAILVRRPSEPS